MSEDIRPILAGWNFEPDLVQVRIISGDDGTQKIQMRMDLGLLQMEIDGRPDGERPEGYRVIAGALRGQGPPVGRLRRSILAQGR